MSEVKAETNDASPIQFLAVSIAAKQFTVPLPTGKEIARAVNSHAALVAAAQAALDFIDDDEPTLAKSDALARQLEAALALARGDVPERETEHP